MQSHSLLAILVAVSVGILGACSGSPRSGDSDSPVRVPSGFELVLGEGGGVTGTWTGHTISSDGSVSSWSGPVAETGLKPAGNLDSDQVASIWTSLQEIVFDSLEIHERGEITAFLLVRTDSSDHRVSWVPSVENIEEPRYPIESLYRDIRKAAIAASQSP